MSDRLDLLELQRKINILWNLANICKQCNTYQLRLSGTAVYPPVYYCPYCSVKDHQLSEKKIEKEKIVQDYEDEESFNLDILN